MVIQEVPCPDFVQSLVPALSLHIADAFTFSNQPPDPFTVCAQSSTPGVVQVFAPVEEAVSVVVEGRKRCCGRTQFFVITCIHR